MIPWARHSSCSSLGAGGSRTATDTYTSLRFRQWKGGAFTASAGSRSCEQLLVTNATALVKLWMDALGRKHPPHLLELHLFRGLDQLYHHFSWNLQAQLYLLESTFNAFLRRLVAMHMYKVCWYTTSDGVKYQGNGRLKG